MANNNKGDLDTKHFLMAIISIVAIVAISFIAVLVIGLQSGKDEPIVIGQEGIVGNAWGAGDYDCINTCIALGTSPSVCNSRCSQQDVRQAIALMESYGLLS